MSDYDRYANTRYGAGLARSGVAVDQGLRAYMIGVYNYMTLGLGVTGLVAYAAFTLGTVNVGNGRLALTDFGHAIYASPLRWLIVLSPLALVFWLSARINSMSVSTARNAMPPRTHSSRILTMRANISPICRRWRACVCKRSA